MPKHSAKSAEPAKPLDTTDTIGTLHQSSAAESVPRGLTRRERRIAMQLEQQNRSKRPRTRHAAPMPDRQLAHHQDPPTPQPQLASQLNTEGDAPSPITEPVANTDSGGNVLSAESEKQQPTQTPSFTSLDQDSVDEPHSTGTADADPESHLETLSDQKSEDNTALISQYLTSTALMNPEQFTFIRTNQPPAEGQLPHSSEEIVEATPPRYLRKSLVTSSALIGASALILTLALPGVQTISPDENENNNAGQQHMHTDESSDIASNFDALNIVSVEAGDTPGSFSNYTDALIQYPFAQTVSLTDPFGERAWPVSGFHDAQDFAAAAGTPVQVIADGTVIEAGYASDGCGFGLKIAHVIDGQNVTSRYCHMQNESHALQIDDVVSVGDHAGRVGNTGLSFGPHLHFVITVDGEAIDPMPFLLQHNRDSRK